MFCKFCEEGRILGSIACCQVVWCTRHPIDIHHDLPYIEKHLHETNIRKMKFNILKNANYLGWIVIVLVFVLVYFYYFFSYIPKQETRLQQRSFRILKEYGVNMFDKSRYYETHFKNYRLFYKIRACRQENKIEPKSGLVGHDSIAALEVERVVNELYDYVETDVPKAGEEDTLFLSKGAGKAVRINYNPLVNSTIADSVITTVSGFYTREKNGEVSSLLNQKRMLNVPIKIFMQDLKYDRLFENIILFDEKEIFHNSRGDLVTDITNPKLLFDTVLVAQGGVWMKLDVRGEDKQILVIPLDFLGKRFCLAGIIAADDFTAKTRTINNQLLILLAAFLLLILIGMPILKIIFIGKTERLKAVDASSSVISTIFGTGLLILITIAVIKHEFADHPQAVERIKKISNVLLKNVEKDLASLTNLYEAITDSTSKCTTPLSSFARTSFAKSDVKFHLYPDALLDGQFKINEILLIGPNGVVNRAVTRTPFSETVPADLSTRNYFRNVVNPQKAWPNDAGFRFYLESIRSYNTGKGETAVSFPTVSFPEPVMAITAAIPSLYHQVLPADVEFLMINAKGRVLYHSDETKNLHENFLEESESLPRMKQAMQLRSEDIFHLSYNERRWLIRIVPVENTPLFHITLINLQLADNQNARIFLFSFYFLVVILLVVGAGMILFRMLPTASYSGTRKWFLWWLLFIPGKRYLYLRLVVILIFVLAAQLLGFWVTTKPVELLFYQIIFIVYTALVLKLVLSRKPIEFQRIFRREYFPENSIAFLLLVFIALFVVYWSNSWRIVVPLAVLALLLIPVPGFLRTYHGNPACSNSESYAKTIYLLLLFLILMSFSAVPVLQFYFAIKNQEINIRNHKKMVDMGRKNLALWTNYKTGDEQPWLQRIQGNNIDQFKIAFVQKTCIPTAEKHKGAATITRADEVYAKLPDPVVNGFGTYNILKTSGYAGEWVRNDTVLYYSQGGTDGAVKVEIPGNRLSFGDFLQWVLRFSLVILFLSVVVWTALAYIARAILNLKTAPTLPEIPAWKDLVWHQTANKNILLQSFDGDYYLQQTLKSIPVEVSMSAGTPTVLQRIDATQMVEHEFDAKRNTELTTLIIWISGLDLVIHEITRHEVLLSNWNKLQAANPQKIVVDIPFNLARITEVYDEYLADHEPEKAERVKLMHLKKQWQLLFSAYVCYNGFRETAPSSTEKGHLAYFMAGYVEIPYKQLWNHLTNPEKLILYDIAEDGLLNVKNEGALRNLADKGLIVFSPVPALVSGTFQRFIQRQVSHRDAKELESRLGTKGKWKNTRYLILLILLPLAAFILISQGMSIEKIFGIFAGIITVASGVLRLFDSQVFTAVPK